MNQGSDIPLIQFLWLALISFIAAFSKTLNDYAISPEPKKYTFILFISKVLLSGICGVLIGALSAYILPNIYLETFSCGAGGLLGTKSITMALRIISVVKKIQIPLDDELNDKKKKED